MFYVYVLRSESHPSQTYIGFTHDLRKRIGEHNSGKSSHTKKYVPWVLRAYVGFPDEGRAKRFEAYLKSGSGRAFARRHLLDE
jgi:putative endonuclease